MMCLGWGGGAFISTRRLNTKLKLSWIRIKTIYIFFLLPCFYGVLSVKIRALPVLADEHEELTGNRFVFVHEIAVLCG